MEVTILAKAHRRKNRPGPGHNGQREERDAPRDMPRPYAVGGETIHDERPSVNVRETPLEHMYARGVISDAEKRAGDLFRRYCEEASLGGGVIDPGRIKVDHSGAGDPMTDRALDAETKLREAARRVGQLDYALLHDVCAVGKSFLEVARLWYLGLDRTPTLAREAGRHVGRRVRDALAVLADLWGCHGGSGKPQQLSVLRPFDKAALDPGEWNYDPEATKTADKARRRRRRKKG